MRKVAEIAYGFTVSELRRKAFKGNITLGMDVVTPESDKWRCDNCGLRFGLER